ncbi:MAG: hypothetical protein HFG22_11170 [Lachnospiraceae bacterium]|nr:hypothetical protein [Lachnospiraceae bacterium]
MMEGLISFFSLYLQEEYWFDGSLWLMMMLLYGNTIFYLIDLYELTKRRSKAETAAMLAIPGTVSLMGAALAALFVHVPGLRDLEEFLTALDSLELCTGLFLIAVVYVLLWAVCFALRRGRQKKDVVRWMLSCVPDACFVLMISICSLYRLAAGASLFRSVSEWVLWIYLYAVYLLSCKVLLFALYLVVQLYSIRLVCFRWKEGDSPSLFLFCYYVFFQNAIFRNIAAFELGILIPLTLAVHGEGWTGEMVLVMGFLYLCGIFTAIFSLRPVMESLDRFRRWGDPRQLKEQFCREYFIEEPVWKNESYTITRDFLVDTQRPAAFYYWRDLKCVEDWSLEEERQKSIFADLWAHRDGGRKTLQKGGRRIRRINFYNGGCFQVTEEEREGSAFVFKYARKWEGVNEEAARRAAQRRSLAMGRYQKLVQRLAIVMVLLMMLMAYGRR